MSSKGSFCALVLDFPNLNMVYVSGPFIAKTFGKY